MLSLPDTSEPPKQEREGFERLDKQEFAKHGVDRGDVPASPSRGKGRRIEKIKVQAVINATSRLTSSTVK
jgi:hypothetical protein